MLRTVYNGRFPNDSDVRVDYLFAILSCQRFTDRASEPYFICEPVPLNQLNHVADKPEDEEFKFT